MLISLIWSESSWIFVLALDKFEKQSLIEKILYLTYGLPGYLSIKLDFLFDFLPNIGKGFLPDSVRFIMELLILSLPGTLLSFLFILIGLKVFRWIKKQTWQKS